MKHHQHPQFLDAIHRKLKVRLTFFSKKDDRTQTRVCAPLDHAPKRRAKDSSPRYHFWDYGSPSGPHVLSLPSVQILAMRTLDEEFRPEEVVRWDTAVSKWTVPRDWGDYS